MVQEATGSQEAVALFEKLGVCKQLAESAAGLGWKAPTSIQEQAVPHLLAGECASDCRSELHLFDYKNRKAYQRHQPRVQAAAQAKMSLAWHKQAQARQEPSPCPSCR